MTLEEAVAAFEADFTVHDYVPGDFATASPAGDKYVVLANGGVLVAGYLPRAFFTNEEDAAEDWLRQAWAYAETRPGKVLYWRERPTWESREYVAIDQASLMNDPAWRSSIVVTLGRILSRLAISEEPKPKGKRKA